MSEFVNLKQRIESLEAETGINQRPELMNDQQYVEHLEGVLEEKRKKTVDVSKEVKEEVSEPKAKKTWF